MPSPTDMRAVPSGSATSSAREAAERALWRMMSFVDTPLADLDAACAADPAWALPHVMRAGFLLSLTDPTLLADASAALTRAEALIDGAPARERQHLHAVQQLLAGRWHAACATWDALLVEQPRDALALQWAHLWDFYRGDTERLRTRPARALPEWSADDPLQPYVTGLYAFGLEENNLYPQAEDAGRQALDDNACVPWAVHAVAHVMEMQGRFDDGAAWLREHQPMWAEPVSLTYGANGLAVHLWWHMALFRLEAMDIAGVQRLHDSHFGADAMQIVLNRVDSAALLWRLHLLGADVGAACRLLVDGWTLDAADAGFYAFNDLHVVLALLGADDVVHAERWVARCAERALLAADGGRANHAVLRDVGLPLMRGVLALARGDAGAACDLLYAARARLSVFGGSHAQRDLIDQTLLSAAARSRRHRLGRALLNERLMTKPSTPLTRHWIDQLDA